jgi:hypothetical protein
MKPNRCYRCLAIIVVAAGCAGTSNRPSVSQPPPSPAVLNALDYVDVVKMGSDVERERGYLDAELQEALQVTPNLWRIRWALERTDSGRSLSGRALHLEFDDASRKLVKLEERRRNAVAASWVPSLPR